ncbi:pogo transposable element protein [Rutstroemia sp. NJR-2017a BVV2]|nr:pogo transposable element protein [Rutstroemia sp. NJR-2017a BVV2]
MNKDLAEAAPTPGDRQTYDTRSKCKGVPLSTLYHREHGRPSGKKKAEGQQYLTVPEEKALETFLKLISDFGYPVRIKFLPSFAHSIARQRSTTNTSIKPPNKNWAQAFQKRHPGLKSRRVRALDWKRHESNIDDKIIHWFEVIEQVLKDQAILPENIYNMDKTGVMLYIHLAPLKWHYTCSESGYTDSKITFEWLKRVFDPQTKGQAKDKPRVLICDGFGTHETLEVQEFCFENKIVLYRLPSHTSHKLQPCDIGVFAPLKGFYRDEADRLFRGGANTVVLHGRKHSQKKNILAGWAACGLFPFNPDRVLRKIPKPPTQLTVPRADEVEVGSGQQDEFPPTSVTLVSAEGFMSLHNLIKQNTYILNERSIPRLQSYIEKLANAGERSFAQCALLKDQNQFLSKMNNEAKVRKSTKPVVLVKGQGKVMSYEDFGEARTTRAAKDAAKEATKDKGKRGRKRKSAALDKPETEAAEPEVVNAAIEVITGKRKRRRGRKSTVQEEDGPEPEQEVALTIEVPEPWRAPVACMY